MTAVNSPIPPTAPIKVQGRSRDFVMKSQKALVDTYSWECCLNCSYWAETRSQQIPDATKYSGFRTEELGPGCLKYSVLPPPSVVVIGCEEYEPGVPF